MADTETRHGPLDNHDVRSKDGAKDLVVYVLAIESADGFILDYLYSFLEPVASNSMPHFLYKGDYLTVSILAGGKLGCRTSKTDFHALIIYHSYPQEAMLCIYVNVYMIHTMKTLGRATGVDHERKNLKKILGFVELTQNFRGIERDILLSKEKRLENNTEHSYQLAVVCWYIIGIEEFDLDIDKVIRYALIHDLVEVYAGDTPLYSSTNDYLLSKERREKEAATLIGDQFPEFADLHASIQEYKEKLNAESKFVYAVDKLLPILAIYLDKGHAWKSHGISIDMIIDKNASKISIAPEVKNYFDAMISVIREKPEYFIKENA